MRILIDIGHPAHVHLFRPFAKMMTGRGHRVLFTLREKEFEKALLEAAGFDYISMGRKRKGFIGKALGLLVFDWKEWRIARRFRPDVLMSHGSMYAAHAAWLLGRPHISFEDTYNMEQIRLYEPFTSVILTGDYPHPVISKKELHIPAYHELAYLHPAVFTPDRSVLGQLGMSEGGRYVLLRFVSWGATHDAGHKGMSLENKRESVKRFSKYARVFISSESPLPADLEPYRLPTPPERIHDVLAFASLVFGESATMVSEGAVLGVPGVYLDNTGRYYTAEQESRYGLCFNFTESSEDQALAIAKGEEILRPGADFSAARARLLEDKIDLSSWLVNYVEDYVARLHTGKIR